MRGPSPKAGLIEEQLSQRFMLPLPLSRGIAQRLAAIKVGRVVSGLGLVHRMRKWYGSLASGPPTGITVHVEAWHIHGQIPRVLLAP